MTRYSAFALAFILLAACSGDDEGDTPGGSGGVGGGSGGMGGATGGMGGMTGGMGGMTGGMGGMGGATGGMGGMTGGMGGMTGGMGGSGGMMMDAGEMDDDDGGVEDSGADAEVDAGTDAGSDSGADAGTLYEEGAQNGPCRTGGGPACDGDLGCYAPDNNNYPRFCTLECSSDEDCEGLTDAVWTCWIGGGRCRVACDPDNDNADCPAGFECIDVLGNDRCMPIE